MSAVEKLNDVLKALDTVDLEMDRLVRETIAEDSGVITDLTRQRLLSGKDSAGQPLAPYSDSYVRLKQRRGLYRGVTDLRLEGDFQDNLFVETQADFFQIDSRDFKTPFLEKKYGDILSLSPEQADLYSELHFRPKLQTKVKTLLRL